MGQKKKERPGIEQLFSAAMHMLVPEYILTDFEMWDAKEYSDRWVIEMREKPERIPLTLQEFEDVVQDGYCNPVEMLSHSFVCKPIYLRL
ncbi:MAG: hypothetical protein LBM67_03865, partial [Lentimicrobiaceae bacterium]|nr:hypothetical protein [Lentimicrobiaceae bacterium]